MVRGAGLANFFSKSSLETTYKMRAPNIVRVKECLQMAAPTRISDGRYPTTVPTFMLGEFRQLVEIELRIASGSRNRK